MKAALRHDALDALMPMHLLLDPQGRIIGAGRAMQRLTLGVALPGMALMDVVTIERPAKVTSVADLAGRRVSVTLRAGAGVELRGHGVAIDSGRVILNLTLALGELQTLQGSGLTAADFAPTDPILDMLYLLEAKALATGETHRLIARLQSAKSVAETQATTDPLTGLVNRRGFGSVLRRAIAARTPFALAHIDLDHFKAVNDGLGHPAGDAVLVAVAQRLSKAVRASDTVARIGGDEFTIVLHRLTDRGTLSKIARRIVAEMEKPVSFEGQTCRVSASIGIAISLGGDVTDPDTMIADADSALYQSKAAGRARHSFTGPSAIN